MHESRTRVVVEIALTVALAAVLRRFAVWQMPFGGSVSLEMLPPRGPRACAAAFARV